MNSTWINHSVYGFLEKIGQFQNFYTEVVPYLAGICFLMAIGMSCVKVFLQASNLREEIIKLFLSFVYYTIMLWAYPIAMKAILPFAMDLGYQAVFKSGAWEVDIPKNDKGHTKEKFYQWLGDKTGGIFSVSTESGSSDGAAVKKALDFNIVDSKTGYIDLNKTFRFILAFVQIMWHALPKMNLRTLIPAIVTAVLFIFTMLVGIICYMIVLIQYVMCLIDYFALQGFGILMIPLSLWEGTKSYTSAILGAMGKIIIKLMVISAMMFISVMSIVDIFIEIYMETGSPDVGVRIGNELTFNLVPLLKMCITVIFQSLLLYVVTQQTEKIAGFLSGGNPSLSLMEFFGAAAATTATGVTAANAGKSAVNGLESFKSGVANTVKSGAIGASEGALRGAVSGGTGGAIAGGITGFAKSAGKTGGKALAGGLASSAQKFGNGAAGAWDTIQNMSIGRLINNKMGNYSSGSGKGGFTSAMGANSSSTPVSISREGEVLNEASTNATTQGAETNENINDMGMPSGADINRGIKPLENQARKGDTSPVTQGVFGSASSIDGKNGDSLISKANGLSYGDAFNRKAGQIMGTIGNIKQGYNSVRSQYIPGGSRGVKNFFGAISKGLSQGLQSYAKGGYAAFMNQHTMELSFGKLSYTASHDGYRGDDGVSRKFGSFAVTSNNGNSNFFTDSLDAKAGSVNMTNEHIEKETQEPALENISVEETD